MAPKKKNRKGLDPGLAFACLCYGGLLGYYLGEAAAEKRATARAKELRLNQTISSLAEQVYVLQHPEMFTAKEEAA